MGGLFSGTKKTTQSQTTDTGPSKFQAPFLQDAFGAAQSDFQSKKDTPFYDGDLYAGMTPESKASLDKLKAYATGTGLDTANSLSALGTGMAGYGAKAGSTIDDFLKVASEDPTQANIAAAKSYAADPYIDAMVDASSRDVTRNLNESTLPSIDRLASAGGNINSSRTGVAEGIARRGAEDRVADIGAQLRSDAYNRGLTLASGDRATKLNAMGTAATAYQGLAGTGISALKAGADTGYGAFSQVLGADATEQADRQGSLDAAFKKWQGQDTRASDILSRYYSIVGNNSWGSSGTSTGTTKQTGGPGILSQLVGAGALAASFIPSGKKRA